MEGEDEQMSSFLWLRRFKKKNWRPESKSRFVDKILKSFFQNKYENVLWKWPCNAIITSFFCSYSYPFRYIYIFYLFFSFSLWSPLPCMLSLSVFVAIKYSRKEWSKNLRVQQKQSIDRFTAFQDTPLLHVVIQGRYRYRNCISKPSYLLSSITY